MTVSELKEVLNHAPDDWMVTVFIPFLNVDCEIEGAGCTLEYDGRMFDKKWNHILSSDHVQIFYETPPKDYI